MKGVAGEAEAYVPIQKRGYENGRWAQCGVWQPGEAPPAVVAQYALASGPLRDLLQVAVVLEAEAFVAQLAVTASLRSS